jgi:hypothetical protein
MKLEGGQTEIKVDQICVNKNEFRVMSDLYASAAESQLKRMTHHKNDSTIAFNSQLSIIESANYPDSLKEQSETDKKQKEYLASHYTSRNLNA